MTLTSRGIYASFRGSRFLECSLSQFTSLLLHVGDYIIPRPPLPNIDTSNSRRSTFCTEAAGVTMGFPFFCFPLQIRKMIYEDVFQTPSQDGVISPDPTYFRRRIGGDLASRTINNGLGLLTSCQQANHEAAAVLYSNHVFSFDDVQYENLTSMLDISAINHSNVRIEEQGGYVFYMVPRCDRVLMYDWLLAIGDQNRQRIRHIELQIFDDLFMFADGTPNSVMGDHLAQTLQLIASSHHLETISLSFEIPKQLQDSSYLKSKGYNTEGFTSLFLPKWFDLSDNLLSAHCPVSDASRDWNAMNCPD